MLGGEIPGHPSIYEILEREEKEGGRERGREGVMEWERERVRREGGSDGVGEGESEEGGRE